jgi:hypothetical protein
MCVDQASAETGQQRVQRGRVSCSCAVINPTGISGESGRTQKARAGEHSKRASTETGQQRVQRGRVSGSCAVIPREYQERAGEHRKRERENTASDQEGKSD